MTRYFRPLVQTGVVRPEAALPLVGGAFWFTHVECLRRNCFAEVMPASALPLARQQVLSASRRPIGGVRFDQPALMGILNVTPDSFSDGGQFQGRNMALARAREMVSQGADILDIGGESTRPGAVEIDIDIEISRIAPVISAIRAAESIPISIDTRKAKVAEAAALAGANIVNDVSGFTFDPNLAALCRDRRLPVVVMHAQGLPQIMQGNPQYDDVVLDVYDFLHRQIDNLVRLGLARDQIIADPGIGFGKTVSHNLALLNRISLFHGLGVPLLLGASRKGFIRVIGKSLDANDRMPGSVAVGLAALSQGVQILRVHDVSDTRQAINLWQAVLGG